MAEYFVENKDKVLVDGVEKADYAYKQSIQNSSDISELKTNFDSLLEQSLNTKMDEIYDKINNLESQVGDSFSDQIQEIETRLKDLEYTPISFISASISPSESMLGSVVTNMVFNIKLMPHSNYHLDIYDTTHNTFLIDNEEHIVNVDNVNAISDYAEQLTKNLNVNYNSNTSFDIYLTDQGSPSRDPYRAVKTVKITFKYPLYYGVSAIPSSINDVFVKETLKNYVLANSLNSSFTLNCSTNQYIWFAIPNTFGNPKFAVNGFYGGFEKINSINLKTSNDSSATYLYDIWRSSMPNLGNTTVVITS